MFVSSMDPLRIYLYDDGLVRFASGGVNSCVFRPNHLNKIIVCFVVKYSNEMSSLHDRYMHLTNYSINKNSSQYTQNEDAEACQGHKWQVAFFMASISSCCFSAVSDSTVAFLGQARRIRFKQALSQTETSELYKPIAK